MVQTVFVKLAVFWLEPQFRTADHLSHWNPAGELEDWVPLEELKSLVDVLWFVATTGCFLLFGVNLILLSWIKFLQYSVFIPISCTVIMAPTLAVVTIFSALDYAKGGFAVGNNNVRFKLEVEKATV
jgi:hypothetical protein